MKKLLLILCGSIASFISNAQIMNGSFETWYSIAWEDPDTAETSNGELIAKSKPANVTKVTPAQNGTYAIKLETSVTSTDTNFAYCLFGSFGNNGPEGGFPYTQKPATINGYYKANIVAGDSAGFIVAFRKGGVNITMDLFKIGVSQTGFTAFSFPLSIATYSVNPDSVVLAMVSSVPTDIDPSATPKNGTWIILDNITLGGTGITQQIPNTNFELWNTISIENPQSWTTFNVDAYRHLGKKVHATKTNDKYKGNYALKLTTIYMNSNNSVSSITNGLDADTGGYYGGVPFTNQIDTLIGYYKYTPSGTDTASIGLDFRKAGANIWYTGQWLLPASSYTYFEIPVNLIQAPDSVRIDLTSSKWPTPPTSNGSMLTIDEIQWKSAPLTTAINQGQNNFMGHKAFPNPAKNHIDIAVTLDRSMDLQLSIYDLNGKLVYKNTHNQYPQGRNVIRVNTNDLSAGNYVYSLSNNEEKVFAGKFIVE